MGEQQSAGGQPPGCDGGWAQPRFGQSSLPEQRLAGSSPGSRSDTVAQRLQRQQPRLQRGLLCCSGFEGSAYWKYADVRQHGAQT